MGNNNNNNNNNNKIAGAEGPEHQHEDVVPTTTTTSNTGAAASTTTTTSTTSTASTTVAVVNIASIASFVSFPIAATYSASKAATHSLTQAQRRELGNEALVVGVYPGPIDTDMAENIPMDKTPPSMVAKSIVDALLSGQEDVYPDKMAMELHNGWQSDAKAVENMMAQQSSSSPPPPAQPQQAVTA